MNAENLKNKVSMFLEQHLEELTKDELERSFIRPQILTFIQKIPKKSFNDAVQAGQNIARQRRIKEIADLKEQLAKMEKELESSDEKIVKKIKLGTQDDEDDEIFFSPTINELLSQNTSNFSQN